MNSRITAIKWFRDAKFGICVHWGLYSIIGRGEWVMNNERINIAEYERLAEKFNPSMFDATEWVDLFKKAGARYITFTTKHHDGFCMFESGLTNYKVTNTHLRRDIVKELIEASTEAGIKFFFYYSLLDWHNPDYYPLGSTGHYAGRREEGHWESYLKYYLGQVRELCQNYGQIGGFWFDGWWDKPDADWRLNELYSMIHSLQPSALVGNNHHVDPFPGEDFQMFEQDLPGSNIAGFNLAGVSALPLETCLTINSSWGYNASDNAYKSSEALIRYLENANNLGANLLLNVGPLPDGQIHPEQRSRLLEIGSRFRNK